jgi:probable rRNA maturation factor
MSVEILNESGEQVDEDRFRRLITHALDQLHVHPDAELSLIFVEVPAMERLHVRWLDEPGPTDVLSFPMDELRPGSADRPTPPGILGDIVVCPEVAARQAEQAGHSAEEEMLLLVTHGLLHLLGFDHAEEDERREMFGLQNEILASFLRQDRAPGR